MREAGSSGMSDSSWEAPFQVVQNFSNIQLEAGHGPCFLHVHVHVVVRVSGRPDYRGSRRVGCTCHLHDSGWGNPCSATTSPLPSRTGRYSILCVHQAHAASTATTMVLVMSMASAWGLHCASGLHCGLHRLVYTRGLGPRRHFGAFDAWWYHSLHTCGADSLSS